MSSDRTPAEALARARWDRELDPDHPWHVAWDDVSPRLRQEQVEFAEADIELLAVAGFRVTPEPDDTTRALATRLRDFPSLAFRREDTVYEETEHGDQRERYLADVRAAADLIEAQAAELAALRQRLDDSWYIDIGARYDAAVAQRDALLDAIGDPEELRGHELDMSDGTVNTPEATHEIVRDILLRIAAAVPQDPEEGR